MKSTLVMCVTLLSIGACQTARPEDVVRRRITAVHEAGHVVLILAHPDVFTLRSSHIRGAEGSTYYDYVADGSENQAHLLMQAMMAGAASEDLFFGKTSDGSRDDQAKARVVAKRFAASRPDVPIDAMLLEEFAVAKTVLTTRTDQLTGIANQILHTGHY